MIMINDKVDGLRKCNEPKSGSHLPLICILRNFNPTFYTSEKSKLCRKYQLLSNFDCSNV